MSTDAVVPNSPVDVAVLDDDADFRHYIEDFLNDEGIYSVRAFSHPHDLFDDCAQNPPDILLLDMKMGEFQGQEVLGELLAKHPDLCVIVVTGYPSLEDMRATFKLKVFDYLAKPFSLSQLRQVLKNAIEYLRIGARGARPPAPAFGPPHQDAAGRARLVSQGPGGGHTAEHFSDQLHRARRQPAQHGKPAGPQPRLWQEAVGAFGLHRLLNNSSSRNG